MALTPKQRAFVDAYLVDRNATRAAATAGYSAKTAHSAGPRLLANVGVAAEINKRSTKLTEKAGITALEVLAGLKREADGSMEDSTGSSRVSAWGLLGKHLAMFVDKTELTGADGGPIVSIAITRTVTK